MMKKDWQIVSLGFLISLVCWWYSANSYAATATETGSAAISLAPMLKKAMPAVVNVVAQGKPELIAQQPDEPAANNDEDDTEDNKNKHAEKSPAPRESHPREAFENIGSGVVIDTDKGYVITNAHLVRGAQTITVTLTDGRHIPAKLMGADSGSDIAILKVDSQRLTALPLGDSSKLNVGDPVVAIGNPFGLNRFGPTSTATSGIISALQRSGMEIESYENFIQTDASINPGNSGGALVNLKGELIGINTAILAPNGGNIGIGFAIPINMANSIAQQLIKYGAVRRGLMGVLVQPLTPELAQALKIPQAKGALVAQVNPDTPAETAGVKVGDLIQKMNGQTIDNAAQVRNIIGLLRVGDKIALTVLRDGKTLELAAKVVDPRKHEEAQQTQQSFLFGLALKNYAEESPYHGTVKGIQVIGLTQNSPAWRSGIRPGDIITMANQQSVSTTDDVKKAARVDNSQLLLHVLRGPGAAYVVVK